MKLSPGSKIDKDGQEQGEIFNLEPTDTYRQKKQEAADMEMRRQDDVMHGLMNEQE